MYFVFFWPRGTKYLKLCRTPVPTKGLLETDQVKTTPSAITSIEVDHKEVDSCVITLAF